MIETSNGVMGCPESQKNLNIGITFNILALALFRFDEVQKRGRAQTLELGGKAQT